MFVTWRLFGSLPRERAFEIAKGEPAGRSFAAIDRELAKVAEGPRWLKDPRIAVVVADALKYGEQQLKLYSIRAWVIMPNHMHILIYPKTGLSRITKSIKGFSGRAANNILDRSGQAFWQNESYDHWVRDQHEMEKVVRYIEGNPVAAGLVNKVEDWKWSSGWAGQEAYPTGRLQ